MKTPNHDRLKRTGRFCGGSIGQFEALAGIDIQSHAERKALWDQFAPHHYTTTQDHIDAVMEHCAKLTLQRIKRGELCLFPRSEEKARAA